MPDGLTCRGPGLAASGGEPTRIGSHGAVWYPGGSALVSSQIRTAVFVLASLIASAAAAPAAPAYADAKPLTVAQASRQLDEAVARLNQLNDKVEAAQGQLDAANRKLAADALAETKLEAQISALARYEYEQPSMLVRVFAAGSVSGVLSELNQTRIVAGRERALRDRDSALRRQDQQARDSIATSLQQIKDAQKQATAVAADAQTAYQSAKADELRQQAARVAAMAAVQTAPAAAPPPGQWPNHFSYGYCTWYVANKRYVPWFGNAIQWWPNARAYGYAEGSTPKVGAIMVTGESSAGHVAYVEAVNGDGSWTVSEMNYVGWNTVDTRTIRPGQVPLLGFIY